MTVKLRDYLAQTERTYDYKIKSVVPLNDAVMDVIERMLARYIPQKIGRVTKTPFHTNPLDFPNLVNGAVEVYVVEITTGMPLSGYAFGTELTRTLRIPDKFIIVRGANDPTELEEERLAALQSMDDAAEKEGLTQEALLNHSDYPEADPVSGEDLYGDKYNGRLVGYLKKAQDERAKAAIKPPKPFEYLEPKAAPADDAKFNEDKEGLKPASKGNDRPVETGPSGNLDDVRKLARRIYRDNSGATKVKTK